MLAQLTSPPDDSEGATSAPASLLEQVVPMERLSPRPTPESPAPAMARAGEQLLPTPACRAWATRSPDEARLFDEGPIITDLLAGEPPTALDQPEPRPPWFASLWEAFLRWLGP